MPPRTMTASTASAAAAPVVPWPRKLQATPSWISCASTTGARAHDSPSDSRQAHQARPAPYPRKNRVVVTPMVTRAPVRENSSATPNRASSSASTPASAAAIRNGPGTALGLPAGSGRSWGPGAGSLTGADATHREARRAAYPPVRRARTGLGTWDD